MFSKKKIPYYNSRAIRLCDTLLPFPSPTTLGMSLKNIQKYRSLLLLFCLTAHVVLFFERQCTERVEIIGHARQLRDDIFNDEYYIVGVDNDFDDIGDECRRFVHVANERNRRCDWLVECNEVNNEKL